MATKIDNVIQALAVVFYFLTKLTGQLPYNLSVQKSTSSRLWFFYAIVFTAIMAFTFIFEGVPMLHFKLQGEVITGLNNAVTHVHYVSKICVAIAICLSDICNSKYAVCLSSNFGIAYRKLVSLEEDDRTYRLTFVIFIVRTLIQIVAHTVTNILKFLYIVDQDLHVGWFPVFILMLPSIVISICANKHAAIVMSLTHGLAKLNGLLDNEVKFINGQHTRTKFQRVTIHSAASERIDKLADLHNHLYVTIQGINDLYSCRILLIVGYLFINIITELYFIADHIARRVKGCKPAPHVIEIFGVTNLLLFSAELYFIVKTTQFLKETCEQTGIIIHNICAFRFDQRLKQSIENLSIHLLLTDINLKPLQLFSLNSSTLYRMIYSITTFLIILVQFKMAEDNEVITKSKQFHNFH